MLKITRSLKLTLKLFRVNNNEITENDSRAYKMIINLSKYNKSRNLMHVPNIGAIEELIFLIYNTKKIFNYLKQGFIKALIFQHFDLKSYI